MATYESGYEAQQRHEAEARAKFGPAARDLAAYIRECNPDTASDFEGVVEQWIRDHGGYSR